MQQTKPDEALELAVKFGDVFFLEHEPGCSCVQENPIPLHRKKCKVVKKGRCTCKPVFVHAAVRD